ncbi:triphosphoribosyl-dephospho-CoA synthase CitG [Schnuerera sp. xch1]|uniref:triphosphoribosyl-dephospho-CoA synthase CitG n=1 Tax=Schnuerera sp. xch1 TaxID=2874283 RepID=UPI001CBDB998|nr:triphosphoribosyl-dephospho-CoA synthase CitG [Schnuerera sp. xch1]MBZ2175043.1 triphosphoribosyl-dephospho-CoA synthase CitG [Schnuerera sp. xch1]
MLNNQMKDYITEKRTIKEDKESKINNWAHQLSIYAQQGVLYEAVLCPKPGLVDPVNSGAHTDMNIFTFMDSSSSLYEGFYQYAKTGLWWGNSPKKLFQHIRPIGIRLEKQMFKETKGINTHKGIIFSMGIFLAAAGLFLQKYLGISHEFPILKDNETDKIFGIIKEMTLNLVDNDFQDIYQKKNLTNGEKLYLKYGFTGVRGEAEAGYPCVQKGTLPLIRTQDKNTLLNIRLLEVLLFLMSSIEDSNVGHRGGLEALQLVKTKAKYFINNGGLCQANAIQRIEEMNRLFTSENISPGGSADLLSITVFLGKLENIF